MKQITKLYSGQIGKITVGDNLGIMSQDGLVKSIEEYPEWSDNPTSYFVYFEKSTRTLEVLDAKWLIRDEVR